MQQEIFVIYKNNDYDINAITAITLIVLKLHKKELIVKKFILIALSAMALLSACNTISGAGQDVKAAGGAVSNAAEDVKAKM